MFDFDDEDYRGPPTEPEGGKFSRRNCLKESSLQPVVDPWEHNFLVSYLTRVVEFGTYCTNIVLRKKIPGWSSSATQDPECPAQTRLAVDLVTASDSPIKKQRHPDLSSCQQTMFSPHWYLHLFSRDLHQICLQCFIFKVTSLSQPSGQL